MQQMTLGDQNVGSEWEAPADLDWPLEGSREAARKRLEGFIANAGRAYQTHRNADRGVGRHVNVSVLSPYLRHRMIEETEVLEAVLAEHSESAAFKFIQEVFWRGYWKGWLEHRSLLWPEYQRQLPQCLSHTQQDRWLGECYERAVSGATDIPLFNEWCLELKQTGYLHNHARMWFASIWIFTLRLPWQLGADFFVRHLLDGDPASNTLGWRWVAGLHTQGKTYLATAKNIRTCAGERLVERSDQDLGLNRLVSKAHQVQEYLPAKALQKTEIQWPKPEHCDGDGYRCNRGKTALLVTEEDLTWYPNNVDVLSVAVLSASPRSVLAPASELVQGFVHGALVDALGRAGAHYAKAEEAAQTVAVAPKPMEEAELVGFFVTQQIDQVVCAYAPIGPARLRLELLGEQLAARGIELRFCMRDYDRMIWPHATKGFFQLGKRIPEFLRAMNFAQ
jgi:deoxyribodipyrimidine photo-lyase